jgi:phosphoribosylformylglycinamidine synthase subunit PurL
LKLMASPNLASRRWVWEQYDQSVGANTVQRPGGDAAVVRVHGTRKALAMTTDCTPRYCYADPVEGGKQAVAEAYRNLCAVGARPLAITNCLNFGNPQRPEIMGQLVGCIEGMAEACRALDFPVVSGNVSLYNETKADDGTSQAILPTPAIGAVGLLENWEKSATIGFKAPGDEIIVISSARERRAIGQSVWLREIVGRIGGRPPPIDLNAERRAGEFIRGAISRGLVNAVHDVSDGGLLVALAEMALAGNVGAKLTKNCNQSDTSYWFGEDQDTYVVTIDDATDARLTEAAQAAGIAYEIIGHVGGQTLQFDELASIPLADLRAAHEGFFPKLMGAEGVLA